MSTHQKSRGGKQDDMKDSKSASRDSSASKQSGSGGSGSGVRGGSHEQHVEAGRQSHKNDDKEGQDTPSGNKSGSGSGSRQ